MTNYAENKRKILRSIIRESIQEFLKEYSENEEIRLIKSIAQITKGILGSQ